MVALSDGWLQVTCLFAIALTLLLVVYTGTIRDELDQQSVLIWNLQCSFVLNDVLHVTFCLYWRYKRVASNLGHSYSLSKEIQYKIATNPPDPMLRTPLNLQIWSKLSLSLYSIVQLTAGEASEWSIRVHLCTFDSVYIAMHIWFKCFVGFWMRSGKQSWTSNW